MTKERRKLPRYLCSDDFSETLLTVSTKEYNLISINFNHFGIALYSHKRLPDFPREQVFTISFQFVQQSNVLKINGLSCRLINRHETEVGNQYGFEFIQESITDKSIISRLVTIEKQLEQHNTPENRYGVFD